MDNLGKFLYMAASAFLFIFALTASLYLYLTLDNYIEFATGITNVYDRVEGEAYSSSITSRKIDWGEVYITIGNMDQMHVKKVKVGDNLTFTDTDSDISAKLRTLKNIADSYDISSYSLLDDGTTIQYGLRNKVVE